MKIIERAVMPAGFRASGLHCGIKRSGRFDLALFYSDVPAVCACLWTANKIKAAPLLVDKAYLKKDPVVRAILVNSGNANCFTGRAGIKDAQGLTGTVAGILGLKKQDVLINSTGIIGKRLPVARMKSALPRLVKELSVKGIGQAQKAIRTTDTFDKGVTAKFNIGDNAASICGVAKGAGMIAPNVATMLVFIFSDVNIRAAALKKALKSAARKSFNCITVDGCMSTNDSVMMMANGASGARVEKGRNYDVFEKALEAVCLELAELIVRDAEGISKFIRIKVGGAANFDEARTAALAVANSNLFKAAVYGQNPNFGRIVAAVGASGIDVSEDELSVKMGPLAKKDVDVHIGLKRGNSSAVIYTSDLTPEYIKINAVYS